MANLPDKLSKECITEIEKYIDSWFESIKGFSKCPWKVFRTQLADNIYKIIRKHQEHK